jgi:hypothetical protein
MISPIAPRPSACSCVSAPPQRPFGVPAGNGIHPRPNPSKALSLFDLANNPPSQRAAPRCVGKLPPHKERVADAAG